jgi:hypothetical protein
LPTPQQSDADVQATALNVCAALALGELTVDQLGAVEVVAKPSAARKRPHAQSVKASKTRGLNKPDCEWRFVGFFFMGFFVYGIVCVESQQIVRNQKDDVEENMLTIAIIR